MHVSQNIIKNNYCILEYIIDHDEVIQGMGIYFNPNNESYKRARNSQIYVDKTGLIEYLNKRLSTEENCIALSHARRFGKSQAAGMIDAF